MKQVAILSLVATVLVMGCNSPSLSQRSSGAEEYRNQEPYSKTGFERIDEPAGAESQSEEGIVNPFLEPRERDDDEQRPEIRLE